jgi:S1-C subfamily serine protease
MIHAASWQGSGFVIGNNYHDTFIVTNKHVCTDQETHKLIKWYFIEWSRYNHVPEFAYLVKVDPKHDLCLLRLPGVGYPKAKIAIMPGQLGQKVYTYGNPHGRKGYLSKGNIADLRVPFLGELAGEVTAKVFGGMSGSPLFNEKGQVVGVVNGADKGKPFHGYYVQLQYLQNFLEKYLKFN